MTTWTAIDNARLEPGKPARSVDALALRDNPIAIAEGASGAPRVSQAACPEPKAGEAYLVASCPVAISAGPSGSSVVNMWQGFAMPATGVVRVSFTQESQKLAASGSLVCTTRVIKNGTVIQSWSRSAPSGSGSYYDNRVLDVSVTAGDRLYADAFGNTGAQCYIRDFKITSETPTWMN